MRRRPGGRKTAWSQKEPREYRFRTRRHDCVASKKFARRMRPPPAETKTASSAKHRELKLMSSVPTHQETTGTPPEARGQPSGSEGRLIKNAVANAVGGASSALVA